MADLVAELKKARVDFETAAKKRKDVGDLAAAVKKMGDVEKALKSWVKAYTDKDAEQARKSMPDLANAIKIQMARINAVTMKLKKEQKEDAMELGQEMSVALNNCGQSADGYTQALLSKHASTSQKMKPTMFSGDWIGAKKDFEAKIGKKKPSSRFLGVVRLSSGLETATKILDAASKSNNPDAFKKGVAAYKIAMEKYCQTLLKEAKVAVDKDDTDVAPESVDPYDYQEASKDLMRTLNRIRLESEHILSTV